MKYIIECTVLRSTFVLRTIQLIHVDHTLALLGQKVAIWVFSGARRMRAGLDRGLDILRIVKFEAGFVVHAAVALSWDGLHTTRQRIADRHPLLALLFVREAQMFTPVAARVILDNIGRRLCRRRLRSGRGLALALLKGPVVLLGDASAGIDLRAHFCIVAVLCGSQGHETVMSHVEIAPWLGNMGVIVHSIGFFHHDSGWRECIHADFA